MLLGMPARPYKLALHLGHSIGKWEICFAVLTEPDGNGQLGGSKHTNLVFADVFVKTGPFSLLRPYSPPLMSFKTRTRAPLHPMELQCQALEERGVMVGGLVTPFVFFELQERLSLRVMSVKIPCCDQS